MKKPCRKHTVGDIWCNSQVDDPSHDNVSAGHITVIDNGDELRRKLKRLKAQIAFYKETYISFAKLAKRLMESFKTPWSAGIFADKTHLDETMYYRIVNENEDLEKNDNRVWSFHSVLSFCVGIGADEKLATKVLASAGYVLTGSDEHITYGFLFTDLQGRSIDECNYFLKAAHVKPLGNY